MSIIMVARVFEIVSGLWERPLLVDLMGGASFSPSADGGASVFLLISLGLVTAVSAATY